MESKKILMHCSTQKIWRSASVFLFDVLLKKTLLNLIISNYSIPFVCTMQLQSTIDEVPIKEQVYMYLWYTLVITCVFSANVPVIIASYLTIQNLHLPELN